MIFVCMCVCVCADFISQHFDYKRKMTWRTRSNNLAEGIAKLARSFIHIYHINHFLYTYRLQKRLDCGGGSRRMTRRVTRMRSTRLPGGIVKSRASFSRDDARAACKLAVQVRIESDSIG